MDKNTEASSGATAALEERDFHPWQLQLSTNLSASPSAAGGIFVTSTHVVWFAGAPEGNQGLGLSPDLTGTGATGWRVGLYTNCWLLAL